MSEDVEEPRFEITDAQARANLDRFAARSKVLLNGKLMRVFHGTTNAFDAFSLARLGQNVNNPTTLLGFFFTDTKQGAKRWANYKGRAERLGVEQRVLECYLAIEHPRVVSHDEFDYMLRRARRSTIEKFKQKCLDDGHDGLQIAYVNADGTKETWWVAFQAEQIKSATHNFGTYDSTDPSFTDARARQVALAKTARENLKQHAPKAKISPVA